MSDLILAGTGHRPPKIWKKRPYDIGNTLELAEFLMVVLKKLHPAKVISGMALGFDTALAMAAFDSKIPFIAAVPMPGQESPWPAQAQRVYKELLAKAEKVVTVSEGPYDPKVMQVRNEWMVDNCTKLLALWNGTEGGTSNCIAYARSKKIEVINIWPDWVERKLP